MLKLNAATALVAAILLAPQTASAEAWCQGVPLTVLTNAQGTVMINTTWGPEWVSVCNVRSTWKSIEPSTCFAWFSQISSAVTQHKVLTVYYGGVTACSEVPTYDNAPAPYYISLTGQ